METVGCSKLQPQLLSNHTHLIFKNLTNASHQGPLIVAIGQENGFPKKNPLKLLRPS